MTGSLHKKRNVWYAVLDVVENGRRKQKWITTKTKNKSEANKVFKQILEKAEEGIFVNTCKNSFVDFMKNWLDDVMKTQVEKTTLESYNLTYNAHIKPYFDKHYPDLPLVDLKAKHIQEYINDKAKSGRSDGKGGLGANTLKKHKILFKACLDYAQKLQLIVNDPTKDLILPKKKKFVGSFYTTDQIDKLLQLVRGTTIESAIFLTVYYGFRRSEILGLRWSDISFEDDTIMIQNARVKILSDTVKQPKSEASRRTLPLIPAVKVS